MKNYSLFLLTFVFLSLSACQKSGAVDSADAYDLIADYLEQFPQFETGKIKTKKMKLKSDKDQDLIKVMDELVDEGYITIKNEKKRKKFLSKDSVWIVEPALSEKALPYVVEQGNNDIEVKTIEYVLDEKQKVLLEMKGEKTASATALLLKKKTPFYYFGKDKTENSDFITKKFKLKYNDETGWRVK